MTSQQIKFETLSIAFEQATTFIILKGSTKNLIALLKYHQIERTHGNDVFNTSLSLKLFSGESCGWC